MKIKIEARRQGDESLLSITNKCLKAQVFSKVLAEQSKNKNWLLAEFKKITHQTNKKQDSYRFNSSSNGEQLAFGK